MTNPFSPAFRDWRKSKDAENKAKAFIQFYRDAQPTFEHHHKVLGDDTYTIQRDYLSGRRTTVQAMRERFCQPQFDWCSENINNQWDVSFKIDKEVGVFFFSFERKEDAVLFKMFCE